MPYTQLLLPTQLTGFHSPPWFGRALNVTPFSSQLSAAPRCGRDRHRHGGVGRVAGARVRGRTGGNEDRLLAARVEEAQRAVRIRPGGEADRRQREAEGPGARRRRRLQDEELLEAARR